MFHFIPDADRRYHSISFDEKYIISNIRSLIIHLFLPFLSTTLQRYKECERKGDQAVAENNFFEALLHYSDALRVNPFGAIIYEKRAFTQFKLKYYKEALRDVEKMLALEPSYSFKVTFIYANRNRRERGEDIFIL